MGLLLVLLLFFICCTNGKLYHVIPEGALHDALGRLCEASMDVREGVPDGALPDEHPLCFSVKTASSDLQRAYAEYRDVLQLYGFKVSYETLREYLQRKLKKPNTDDYDSRFCMDIHKLRQIHNALQCKRHDKQHHQGVRNKRIDEFL